MPRLTLLVLLALLLTFLAMQVYAYYFAIPEGEDLLPPSPPASQAAQAELPPIDE